MNDIADVPSSPPAAPVTMSQALSDGRFVSLFRHLSSSAPGVAPAPDLDDDTSSSEQAIAALWWTDADRDLDDESSTAPDYFDESWETTDSAGQSLAGLSLPVFDVVVADDLGADDGGGGGFGW